MLAQQCLLLLALLYAPRTLAVKPFSLRIYTPDGDDYFIKTLNEKWKIDSHDQAHFKDLLKHAKKGIPNHKETKYSVSGQIDWTEELSEQTPVQRRAFWVGRGDPNVVRERDLLKLQCTVSPRAWPRKDIWLFLGPEWSYTDKAKCDSLQVGWLKCLGNGDGAMDWNDKFFVRPEDVETGDKCGKYM